MSSGVFFAGRTEPSGPFRPNECFAELKARDLGSHSDLDGSVQSLQRELCNKRRKDMKVRKKQRIIRRF